MGQLALLGAGAGAAGRTLLFDTFTDADNTALPSHAPDVGAGSWVNTNGSWDIQSDHAHLATDSGAGQNVASFDVGQSDVTLTLDYAAAGAGSDDGVALRVQDSTNYWLVKFDSAGNAFALYEQVGGSFTQRAGAFYIWDTATHGVRVVCSASSITVSVDGVQLLSYGSAVSFESLTKFGPRCHVLANQGTWDNLQVTNP
jgi:hypothetical protein